MKKLLPILAALGLLGIVTIPLIADPPQREPFRPPPLPGQPQRDPFAPFVLPPPPQPVPVQAQPREDVPEEVIRALTGALKDDDLEVRKLAAATLAQLRQGKKAIATLVDMLNNTDAETRKFAVDHLATAGPDAVEALVEALKSEDKDTRANAAYALARIGPAAEQASTGLLKLVKDKDSDVRRRVLYALNRIYTENLGRPGGVTVGPGGTGTTPAETGQAQVTDPGVLAPTKK